MGTRLEHLRRQLDALSGPAKLDWAMRELEQLALEPRELAPHVMFSSQSYARNLVHGGLYHHLLVLCWKNGQRSPIHDHRGSMCAVRVLRGTMTETFFERAPNGHIKATESNDVGVDGVVGGYDTDIHQISNLQAGDTDLVTLHVYSPPLLVMGTYSLFERGRGEERMFAEFCDAGGI